MPERHSPSFELTAGGPLDAKIYTKSQCQNGILPRSNGSRTGTQQSIAAKVSMPERHSPSFERPYARVVVSTLTLSQCQNGILPRSNVGLFVPGITPKSEVSMPERHSPSFELAGWGHTNVVCFKSQCQNGILPRSNEQAAAQDAQNVEKVSMPERHSPSFERFGGAAADYLKLHTCLNARTAFSLVRTVQ